MPLCGPTHDSWCGLWLRLSLPRNKFGRKMALRNRRIGFLKTQQDARENAAF